MAGLYIHIPYCASKCIYCDFYSVAKSNPADRSWASAYVTALIRELDERATELQEPLRTIYLGGGTPSLLPPAEIQRLLAAIAARVDTSQVEEVTLEANPEDVTPAFAEALADTVINRVSMGVQTFVDEELKTIRRRHDSQRAAEAVAALRAAGFHNLSLDLMYGLPGQTEDSFSESISRCLELNVEHISAYCLSVEEGTLLSRRLSRGELTLPDEELCLTFSQMLRRRLKEAGYIQYEISNYARPGYHSRHNSSYWVGTPYLGLGPGAHSFDGRFCRSWNAPDVKQYIEGQRHRESEQLDVRDRYHETVMLGLRTRVGVSASALQTYLNDNPELAQHFHQQYQIIETEGLLHTLPDGNIALTESGLNLADDVIRRLFLPED
jgi:oxygen-independent coproporphyrinogen-3 oxidase